jgi:penicillin-binding protein 1C
MAGGHPALHRLLRELGLSTLDRPADHYGPGLTLGNGEVRLLELANAYATLARGGLHRPFRLLAGRDPSPASGRRLFSGSSAYLIADMLADNRARAASFGLNSHLSLPFPVASKTGTSSDYRDNWVVAFTPEFTVAVWVGNPDGRPMRGITGVTGAAPAMRDIFLHLHASRGTSWFARPPAVRDGFVHPLTGHLVNVDNPAAVREIFVHAPPTTTPEDYDARGRIILAPDYAEWAAGPQNGLGDLVVCAPANDGLRIVSPAPGTIYFLDPDLPRESQRIPLDAAGADGIRWSSMTLEVNDGEPRPTAPLREGRHTITARAGDRTASTWIEVRAL